MEDLSLEGFSENQYQEIKALWQKYYDENNTWLKESDKGIAFRKFCKQVFKWDDVVIDANLKDTSALFEAGVQWCTEQKKNEIERLSNKLTTDAEIRISRAITENEHKISEAESTADMYKRKCQDLDTKLCVIENALKSKGLYRSFAHLF